MSRGEQHGELLSQKLAHLWLAHGLTACKLIEHYYRQKCNTFLHAIQHLSQVCVQSANSPAAGLLILSSPTIVDVSWNRDLLTLHDISMTAYAMSKKQVMFGSCSSVSLLT